jgi:MFS family permease
MTVERPATAEVEDERPRRARLKSLAIDIGPLRSSPAFRRLWIGQAVGFVGWRMTSVAVAFQVWELTGSPAAVGLLALTQFVPLVSLTILGGGIADVADRRLVLVATSLVILLSFAGLAANAGLAEPSVAACFGLSLLSWAAFSLGAGAIRSVTPRLVPEDQLTSAVALVGLYGNLAMVAGPAVGGLLIEAAGLPATYVLATAGACAATWSVLALPSIAPGGETGRVTARTLLEGFGYIRRQRVVLAFFLIDTVAMVFGMPMSLFPALGERFGDAATVGYLFAAPAVGALSASLLSGWVSHVGRQGVAIVLAVLGWGAAITAFGFTTALWLALLLLAIAGAADQVSAIFRGTIVLEVTPDHLRGRVGGIEFAQVASAPALGNLEAGLVASLVSIRFSIVSGGVACIIGTLALVLTFPELLRYDARKRR